MYENYYHTNKLKANRTKAWFRALQCYLARKWIQCVLQLSGPQTQQ